MWSPNASSILVQWRTQLLACPTVTALGAVIANFHYPSFDLTTEPLPAFLLTEMNHKRFRYAEGAVGLIKFSVLARLYIPITTASSQDAGTIETLARDIVKDLEGQYTGFAWDDIDASLSSEPTPAQRADGVNTGVVYRSALITANVGLNK